MTQSESSVSLGFPRALVATLALLLLPLAASPVAAQPVSIGLKGGVSQGTLVGDDVSDADYRAGFSGGIYTKYDVNRAFSVQPELLFTMKGAEAGAGEPALAAGEYEFQYLEIPVLFKLNAPLDGIVQPSVYVGPQLGFNLNGELNGDEIDDETLQTAEFSGVLGGDLGFDLSDMNVGPLSRVVLDGRYAFGLTNTFDTAGDPSIRTGTFTGTLGLEFQL
jgi:opacity protein-like surface antigen